MRWEEFYTRLLFIESVGFTTYGSKPVTEIVLDHGPKKKEFVRKERLLRCRMKNEGFVKLAKKSLGIQSMILKNLGGYGKRGWTRIKESIFNRSLPHQRREYDFVYVVNIIELAGVLKQHYCLFERYMGFDFDPLEAIFDL